MCATPLRSMKIDFRRLTPDERSRWEDLAAVAAEPNPFFLPALLGPAFDHLDRHREVALIRAEADGLLIGLFPVIVRRRHGRYPIRNIATWMHCQCFFGAPLIRATYEKTAWATLLDQIDRISPDADFLHLEGLALEGPVADALRASCAAGRRKCKLISAHERAMLQSDLTADAYLSKHVRAKKRKEMRRLQNRLEELGTVVRRRLSATDDVEQWALDFLALESAGWKGEEGTALGNNNHTRAYFLEALANSHASGMLDMLRIDLDDAPVAMLVNFRSGAGAFSYKIAFDERFSRFSPGVLIEMDNLHAVLSDPSLGWMDSCAAPNHPMIDGIWAGRRTIGQFRVELKGRGLAGVRRKALFAATGAAEHVLKRARGLRR